MRRYFINPELKESTAVLLSLMALFMLFTLLILEQHHKSLKEDYIKALGAIAVKVTDKDPAMEKEIIPLITREISEGEALKGRAFIARYGLTENLDNELFPYINSTAKRNEYAIVAIFTVLAAMLFTLNYLQYGFFYKRIRRLTLGAKKVLEGEYTIPISEDREGDFSKLALSFNSMREAIRNNLGELKKEKQFLADLLSDISHQLKTPLSSMIVYNDIMLSKELSREQAQTFLLSTRDQLNRMNWMIKSMLKLARLDAKAIVLSKKNQSLNDTVQEAIYALESKAHEEGIRIHFDENAEVFFEHDRLWLEEALINIIKNGIEHTPGEGAINIKLSENPVFRRIIIEDTGEGITEQDLPHIFKRFYKAKASKKSDSVGIGLALAKAIVELHNGVIEVQSQVGVGTRFIITFLCG